MKTTVVMAVTMNGSRPEDVGTFSREPALWKQLIPLEARVLWLLKKEHREPAGYLPKLVRLRHFLPTIRTLGVP